MAPLDNDIIQFQSGLDQIISDGTAIIGFSILFYLGVKIGLTLINRY